MAEISFQAFVAGDLHAVGFEAELMQNRDVHVGDIMRMLHGVKADLIRRPVRDAALDPATRQLDFAPRL